MSFAIIRAEKIKTFSDITGSTEHTYRTRDTPNADLSRSHKNYHQFKTDLELQQKIKERIPKKRRSDAVLCIEHLITASPDWDGWGTSKERDYFNKSLDFLRNMYGQDNVVGFSVHRDETTPHLVAYVVPLDEATGRLNCKKWLGKRNALSELQTHFAKHVSDFGLRRGLEGSRAEHTTIREYYSVANNVTKDFKELHNIPEPDFSDLPNKNGMLESVNSYKERIIKEQQKKFDKYKKDVSIQFNKLLVDRQKYAEAYNLIRSETWQYSKAIKGLPYKIKSKLEDDFFEKADDARIQIERQKQFDDSLKSSRKLDLENIDFPELSPDLKKYVELQKEQDSYFLQLQMNNHAKVVKKKYEMLALLMRDDNYRNDVAKILEYDKATKQSPYISQDLVQDVFDNRPAPRTKESQRTIENIKTISHDNDFSM